MSVLARSALEQHSEIRLEDLSAPRALGRQEIVLHELLRQRAGTLLELAAS